MSRLDHTHLALQASTGLEGRQVGAVLDGVKEDLWDWLVEHWDEEVAQVSWWIIEVSIRGKHLAPVWHRIVGPDPKGRKP